MQAGAASAPAAGALHSLALPGAGYIEVPYADYLNLTGGQVTIEGWVYRNFLARSETILGFKSNEGYWFGFNSTGNLRFTPNGSLTFANSATAVQPNRSTHVAVTFGSGVTSFYINGVLDSSTTQPAGLTTVPWPSKMGIGYDTGSALPARTGPSAHSARSTPTCSPIRTAAWRLPPAHPTA